MTVRKDELKQVLSSVSEIVELLSNENKLDSQVIDKELLEMLTEKINQLLDIPYVPEFIERILIQALVEVILTFLFNFEASK